jgi:hypothetical protein
MLPIYVLLPIIVLGSKGGQSVIEDEAILARCSRVAKFSQQRAPWRAGPPSGYEAAVAAHAAAELMKKLRTHYEKHPGATRVAMSPNLDSSELVPRERVFTSIRAQEWLLLSRDTEFLLNRFKKEIRALGGEIQPSIRK